LFTARLEQGPESRESFEGAGVRQGAGGVHRGARFVYGAPGADRVEVLERESQRIHLRVARGAGWILPVILEPRPDRLAFSLRSLVAERRHVWRRRRRRSAEDVFEQPLAAQDRRGAVGIGRDGQEAGMAEQPAALRVAERDAAEPAAGHVWHAIVARQPLVQERVVRGQELADRAIVANLTLEEELGLLAERLAQRLVEFGKQVGVGHGVPEVAQLEPLRGEVLDQRAGPFVGQHPPHLALEHGGVAQRSARRQVEQFVVRDAAPEKEREPGGQLHAGQAVRHARLDVEWIELEAEQEVGADQDALQRRFDSTVERAAGRARIVERQQGPHVTIVDRTAVGEARQAAEDGAGTGASLAAVAWRVSRRAVGCRPAAEDAAAARRLAEADSDERALHRDALHAGIAVEHLVGAEAPAGAGRLGDLVRLPWLAHERDADDMGAGLGGEAQLETFVRVIRVALPLVVPGQGAGKARRRRLHRLSPDREPFQALPVESDVEEVRVGQTSDGVVQRLLQPHGEGVFAVDREEVGHRQSAARAERQFVAAPVVLHQPV
jgi:hypothetical protein